MTSLRSKRANLPPAQAGPGSRVGQVYLNTSRRVLYCLNDRARQLQNEGVPFTPADLDEHPLCLPSGETVTADDLPLIRAWRDKVPQEATFLLTRPGGTVQHISWTAAPLCVSGGEVAGITGTVQCGPPEPDWQALAGLAHDLRTPLQALKLLLALLDTKGPIDPRQRAVLDRIRTSAERGILIGMDLLEWCRGPAQGGRGVERSWFPLVPFLESLAGEQSAEAERKSLQLRTKLEAARAWELYADQVRLGRLFANLLANAVRYTTTGRVELRAAWQEEQGQRVLDLSVVDTGTGILPEEKDSIFQPFERGRAGKEGDSGGSGLGLSVVERLAEELGLDLQVYSEYGRGSAFHLLLPEAMLRKAPEGIMA